ncbi:MAG: nucleotidyltransferase family protein [Spirochaetales bacterium]
MAHNKKIGCVILASGASKRFGTENKLLMNFDGKPVIEYILKTVSQCPFFSSVCVTRRTEIVCLARRYAIDHVLHSYSEKKDTIRLALDFLLHRNYAESDYPLDAVMFCAADQPLLSKKTLDKLCDKFMRYPTGIVRAATFDENATLCCGNPVIFPAYMFEELYNLQSGQNGRDVIANHSGRVRLVPVENRYELVDIDFPKDFMELTHSFKHL